MISYQLAPENLEKERNTILQILNNNKYDTSILRALDTKKKMSLEVFYEKVAEGLLASAGTEIQVQGQTSSPAGRLVGRDHFLYRIPATHAKVEGTSQRSCRMCAERSKRQTRKTAQKCITMYCRKCNVGLCTGQCFENGVSDSTIIYIT